MAMKRVFYVLAVGREYDPRMAGVPMRYGQAMDVPGELAEALIAEEAFSDRLIAPVEPSAPLPAEIQWYEPKPGEELIVLYGVGLVRAEQLVALGIRTLQDMATLDKARVRDLAGEMDGTEPKHILAWMEQAKEIVGG